jgi:hypothetical protein
MEFVSFCENNAEEEPVRLILLHQNFEQQRLLLQTEELNQPVF